MIRGFVTLDLAVSVHQALQKIEARASLRDQLLRAAESVVLNLAEGSGRSTKRDQARFYSIAFGSLREVQAALMLIGVEDKSVLDRVDHVAACLYRLLHPRP